MKCNTDNYITFFPSYEVDLLDHPALPNTHVPLSLDLLIDNNDDVHFELECPYAALKVVH
jgi:hypothetical protein